MNQSNDLINNYLSKIKKQREDSRIVKAPVNNLLQVILPVRGFAILLVIAAHVAITFVAAEANLNSVDGLTAVYFNWWQLISPLNFITLELARVSVPLFLFFAGYHMARTSLSWKAIWKNSKKILAPMLFWSLFSWGISWRKGVEGWNFEEFVILLFTGRTQLGYYFLILIVQFFIVSKWVVPYVKRTPVTGIVVSIAVQSLIHVYDYMVLIYNLKLISGHEVLNSLCTFPEYLFPRFIVSFTLGVWASTNIKTFKSLTEERYRSLLVFFLLCAISVIIETGLIYYYSHFALETSSFKAASNAWGEWKITTALWSITGIFFIIAFFRRWLFFKKQLEKYGKYSYQILILHGMILKLFQLFCYKYLSNYSWYSLLGFCIWFFAILNITMVIIKIAKKYLNRWAQQIVLGL